MKRKIITIIGALLFCNLSFAGIVVQNEVDAIGLSYYPGEYFFTKVEGLDSSLLWEFNQKDTETPFHFMTGLGVGLTSYGLNFTIPTVFEFSLAGCLFRVTVVLGRFCAVACAVGDDLPDHAPVRLHR